MSKQHELINLIATEFKDDHSLVLQCVDLIRRGLFGIILVNHPSKPTAYWADGSLSMPFKGSPQDPYCFTSTLAASRSAARIKQRTGEKWHITLWLHPDCTLLPLDKYRRLRNKFPGSPRK